MTNIIRLKRRAAGGAAGAPATLKTSEVAYNETDNVLYIGFGDDGEGNATTIIALAGEGLFATKAYVNDAVGNAGGGDMLKSVYDSDNDGKVDAAEVADSVAWTGVQGKPSSFPPSAHTHDDAVAGGASGFMTGAEKQKLAGIAAGANNYVHPTSDGNRHVPATAAGNTGKFLKSGSSAGAAPTWENVTKADVGLGNVENLAPASYPISTAQQAALDLKASLASPALTGTPTAPTASQATNNQQIATTAFVKAAIGALIDGSPDALDTLNELAEALGNDPNFAATITNELGGKLVKSANLSDLTNVATARTNLGLGTMATQAASNVNITGGSVSGVTISTSVIDGGTF